MKIFLITRILFSISILTLWLPAYGQHATAFDIADGGQAFQNYCANCHGPDGNLIADIDLARGLFRRPLSDDEIVNIIINGIPETPMPATPSMSEEQAIKIVAYLRDRASIQPQTNLLGNAEQGRLLFNGKGECLDCHRINGTGSRLGPDLSQIGLQRQAAELEISLRDPAAEIQATNRFYTVTTTTGEQITGRLLNHDTFTVMLLDTRERLRSFSKANLRSYGFSEPEMPSAQDSMNDQEIADLVAYLTSLR